MITPATWMPEAVSRLVAEFGPNLLYIGLQGSYRREEAHENSDIDIVAIFEKLDASLLERYQAVVRALPEGDKVCGFVADRAVLANWPRHEIFAFEMDTQDYLGELAPLLPTVTRQDSIDAARIGASALYHLAVHSYALSSPEEAENMLAGAYKGVYFVLLITEYLRSGNHYGSKAELVKHLSGAELKIMTASLDFFAWRKNHSLREAADLLVAWCADVITGDRRDGAC